MTTSILLLSLIQPLHGLTFALLHLACMRMMATLVDASLSATAQAFYAFGAGFITTVLTLLSGIIYARFGGAAFFMMAALCGLAVPFAWIGLAKSPSLQVAGER
jgi:PPP family 3-phenylpropionic acid transporter